jgi:hypothetical protein
VGALHILRAQQQQVLLGVGEHPVAQGGQHAQVRLRGLFAEADVHRDRVETRPLVAG